MLAPNKTIGLGLSYALSWCKKLKNLIKSGALTITSMLIATALYLWGQDIGPDSMMTLLVGTTAIVATVITIAFSLSIIPIEKASETFSAGIIHVVLKDPETRAAFYVLGVLTLLPLGGFFKFTSKLPQSFSLALAVFVIGTSLDILRFYQQNLISKLQPNYVIRALLKEVRKNVKSDRKGIAILLKRFKKNATLEVDDAWLAAVLQKNCSRLDDSIIIKCDSLYDAAKIIMDKGNRLVLRQALSAYTQILQIYLSQRAESAVTFPDQASLFVATTNAATIPNAILEHLGRLSKYALEKKDELSVIAVQETYSALVVLVHSIEFKNFKYGTNPILNSILGRWKISAEEVAKEGWVDAVMRDSGNLTRVMAFLAQRENLNDIYPTVIDFQRTLVQATAVALATKKTSQSFYQIATNRLIENTTAILANLIRLGHWQCDDVSSSIYTVLKAKNDFDKLLKIQYSIMECNPAYQSTDLNNIFQLNRQALSLVEKSLVKENQRSFLDFMKISEHVLNHLRDMIREEEEFATQFQYQFVEGINVLLHTYWDTYSLIRGHEELDAEIDAVMQLMLRAIWLTTFFKTFNVQFSENLVDHLTNFALRVMHAKPEMLLVDPEFLLKIAKTQVSLAIATSRYQSEFDWSKVNWYSKVAANNWYIAKALQLKGRPAEAGVIMKLASNLPAESSSEEQAKILSMLNSLYARYEDDLDDPMRSRSMFRDKPRDVLIWIINNMKQSDDDSTNSDAEMR